MNFYFPSLINSFVYSNQIHIKASMGVSNFYKNHVENIDFYLYSFLLLYLSSREWKKRTKKGLYMKNILNLRKSVLVKINILKSVNTLIWQGQVHRSTRTRSIVIEVVNPLRPLKDLENYTLWLFLKRLRVTMGAYP